MIMDGDGEEDAEGYIGKKRSFFVEEMKSLGRRGKEGKKKNKGRGKVAKRME